MSDILQKFHTNIPGDFGFLEQISFERDFLDGMAAKYTIRVKLAKAINTDSDRLQIEFSGVMDIELGNLESLSGCLLQIRDVSDRQIEGAIFRVTDDEEDIFSFYCSTFRVLS